MDQGFRRRQEYGPDRREYQVKANKTNEVFVGGSSYKEILIGARIQEKRNNTVIIQEQEVSNHYARVVWREASVWGSSSKEAKEMMANKATEWGKFFNKLEIWDGQDIDFQRIAWIRIQGVPIHLWERQVFDKIGSCFGKIALGSEMYVQEEGNLTYDRVGILVNNGIFISEEMELRWKDKKYKIWITEETTTWVPALWKIKQGTSSGQTTSRMENQTEYAPSPGKDHPPEFQGNEQPDSMDSEDQLMSSVFEIAAGFQTLMRPSTRKFRIGGSRNKLKRVKTKPQKRNKNNEIESTINVYEEGMEIGFSAVEETQLESQRGNESEEELDLDLNADNEEGEDTRQVQEAEINEEVSETMMVGDAIGVPLNEFQEQIRTIIRGELEVINMVLIKDVGNPEGVLAFAKRLKELKEKVKEWRWKEKEAEEKIYKETMKSINSLEELAETKVLSAKEN
ncbi:hypothetical protein L1987_67865 [Smallanthus sonchifolius]|uniref:Uncharacterized protein n=1 Tax=Smallanthus sonchifolius TaxID=185202 RepID=A0ACB9B3U7_9ASTR|nr:hypothetical protein L1987_67865 [Smallanthus sonchifolius]